MPGEEGRCHSAGHRGRSGGRLNNPYQDLNIPYKQLYDLPTSLEFLFQESLAQRCSWGPLHGEHAQGHRPALCREPGIESGMVTVRDRDDWINSVTVGLSTGALFRAADGSRSAAITSAIGGVLTGAAMSGKQAAKRYVPAL
uniref:Inner mitochondrial membrane protein n=1 Tax=Oryza sativa subsp. japonica TaxID=39947 RepID=Q9FRF2_ORYSJ|nr:putative inner mitochondrial membrane protein [Oryza sativa Japonica Group]